MRVGIGYDVHPLVRGRKLVLGGIEIPFNNGLDGHSDADVLVHAIIDALLGAAGLWDIGSHFPPEARYKDISSINLLRQVMTLLRAHGWQVNNVDATVVAEQPRLSPFIPQMQRRISETLGISPEQVGVKATTSKGLGFLGKGEGIAAHAVALVERSGGEGI
jgi:2-C-methyl-D-erythritol 2,4-cyclodiphosphate synthase